MCSYPEPTQVFLPEKGKACRSNLVKGSRQISLVSSVEGIPAVLGIELGLQGAVTREFGLFNKNIGGCKS